MAGPLLTTPPLPTDRATFDVILKHGHADLVLSSAFNGYGDRAATGAADGRVRVFNRHRDGVWRACDAWQAHTSAVLELQWLPPSIYPNLVASLGAEGRFKLWAEDPGQVAGRRFSNTTGGGLAAARGQATAPGGGSTREAGAQAKAAFETRSNRTGQFRSFSVRHNEETRHTYLALLAADGQLSVFENEQPENLSEYTRLDEWNVFDVGSSPAGGSGATTGGAAGLGSGAGGAAAAAAAAAAAGYSTGAGASAAGSTGAGSSNAGGSSGGRLGGRPGRGEETAFRVRFDPNPDVCYTALRAGVPTDALGLVVAAMDGVRVYRTRDTLVSSLGVSTPGREFYLAADLGDHRGLVRDVAWAPGNVRGYDVIATACQDGLVRVFALDTPLDAASGSERGWSAAGLKAHNQHARGGLDEAGGRLGGGAADGGVANPQSGIRKGLQLSSAGAAERRAGQRQPGQVRHTVREIARLDSHRTPVWRVGFDDDGQILGSVGDDGKLVCYRQTPDGGWAKSSELGMVKMKMAAP